MGEGGWIEEEVEEEGGIEEGKGGKIGEGERRGGDCGERGRNGVEILEGLGEEGNEVRGLDENKEVASRFPSSRLLSGG